MYGSSMQLLWSCHSSAHLPYSSIPPQVCHQHQLPFHSFSSSMSHLLLTRSAFSLNAIIPPSLFVYFLFRKVYFEIRKFIRHTKNSSVSLITFSVAVQSPRNMQHFCLIFTHFIFCLGSLHLPQYQYAVPSTPTNHYIVTEGFLYLVFHCFTLDVCATSTRIALMAAFLMFYYK